MLELSRAQVLKLFLHAQGLIGAPDKKGGVSVLIRKLGAVQLDTISVLARSHELVPYSRLGAVGRPHVEAAYWGAPYESFEYWGHAMSVLPIEDWPLYKVRRRRFAERDRDSEVATPALRKQVLSQIRSLGPVTSSELGGARVPGGQWWSWSPIKRTVENLSACGEVISVTRRGFKRVYDLPERVVPADLLNESLSDAECLGGLIDIAARCLAVGTLNDLADYFRIQKRDVPAGIEAAGLVPVKVEGWDAKAWAHPNVLNRTSAIRGRQRTTLLSPFDPVVWDRARTERVFGFTHRLEAYVPKPLRVHGYFVMPLLAEGRLCGRVDPKRIGKTLIVRKATIEEDAVEHLAEALAEAANWVECDSVVVEQISPSRLLAPVKKALARL